MRGGSLNSDWFASIHNSQLRRVQWIFYPGHAGVQRNERAGNLAGSANIDDRLTLNGPTVIALVVITSPVEEWKKPLPGTL